MRRFSCLFLALVVLAAGAGTQAASRKLLLDVQTVPLAWGDSRLAEKMVTALSRNPDLQIITPEPRNPAVLDQQPPFPENRTDLEGLLEWGTEVGGRYLLVVTVDREYLERRKSFNLPLIFHKYETVGIITGEYRLVDLQKRRLQAAEPFKVELNGARQYQAEMDDNSSDSKLHIPASAKSRLFSALENRLTEELVEQVTLLTRGR